MDAWRKVMGSAAATVDRAMTFAIHVRSARDRARTKTMSHAERLGALVEIERIYGDASLLPLPSPFFPDPKAADMTLRHVREGAWDASWPSPFEPFFEGVASGYLANVANRTAHARLFLGPKGKPRPALIAVHGYMGGQWMLEEAQWPIGWLLRRGFDVALPILPFHAMRGGGRRGAPPFPSSDPRRTNEGFRQATADIVALARWLRERGAPHVGIMGASLGGYTSALVATVSTAIDFVMPMIPLASIADFAREQGRLGEGPSMLALHESLERVYRVVSPLARPLLLPKTRALVVGAENDRVTPTSHAERIASHFGSEFITMSGGHLLQFGRAEAFRALGAMLEREGIMIPRPKRSS